MSHAIAQLRQLFKLKVYQTSGMDFQIFFSKIMRNLDSNFVGIKPHGNWGDGGNDGYNPKTKHYYQIYAPIASTTPNPIAEFTKAVTDYDKLINKWGDVKGYSFVINDRFTLIQATLQDKFEAFIEEKEIPEGEIICTNKLQKLFMKLDQDAQLEVVDQYYINEEPTLDFEPTLIGELIGYLVNKDEDSFNFLLGEAPNLDEKISFNNISKSLAARLISNYAQVYQINDFLELQGSDLSQQLSLSINKIYKKISASIPLPEEERSSLIYLALRDELIPKSVNQDKLTKKGYTSIAEIIIAKYFSTCDVYEDPKRTSTT